MQNKIETLRAILYTEEDIKSIKNLGDSFTKKDIEFMVEFKKIYELGLGQLEKFISKLDEEGEELDTYSILYYVRVLWSGPLGRYTKDLSKGKKYFGDFPDSLGMLGNASATTQNITIFKDVGYPLGCSVDSYNKLPEIIQDTMSKSVLITENLFRGCMESSSLVDNTLPIRDKRNDLKYDEEKSGKWVTKPHGAHLTKDSFFRLSVTEASEGIFEKVKEFLGEENFRIYKDKKQYNPFNSEKNLSMSINSKIEKEFIENETPIIKVLDLMGEEFDSEERREFSIKIKGEEKEKTLLLNTNEGQLGN